MVDPDAEEDPQAIAVRDQQQAAANELQQRQVEAQLKMLEAKAREVDAKANKEQLQAISKKIEALRQALEVATAAAHMPGLTRAADQIYNEAQLVHIPTQDQVAASQQVNNVVR
jgi:hypothetical protein